MRVDGPFRIPLAGLLAAGPGTDRHERFEGARPRLADDLRLVEPATIEVRIARTNRGVLVTGRVTTAVGGSCARCLVDLASPIDATFAEEVLPAIDLATGQALDRTAEPEMARLDDHHELDLEALVADAISLAEPIAPLCRPDCPGLCLECGARLAGGHVGHAVDPIDPRLAALAGFVVDGDGLTG